MAFNCDIIHRTIYQKLNFNLLYYILIVSLCRCKSLLSVTVHVHVDHEFDTLLILLLTKLIIRRYKQCYNLTMHKVSWYYQCDAMHAHTCQGT